jgi:hypothetical protein
MASAESWDPSAVARLAVIRPAPPADLQLPGPDVPAATPEQAQATDAVFSKQENDEAGAILGFWAAGMLVNDLVKEAAANLAEDEEDDAEEKQPELK